MRKTLNLKDGEAQIGQTVWYVDGTELKSSVVTLVMTDLLESESFTERCDDATPCFCTKAALLDYCQTNEIECIELERDVYKERLESMEKPKSDFDKLMDLCKGFELNAIHAGISTKDGITHGFLITLSDSDTKVFFAFDIYGGFKEFYTINED